MRIAAAARISLSKATWIARWELITAGIMQIESPLNVQQWLAESAVEHSLQDEISNDQSQPAILQRETTAYCSVPESPKLEVVDSEPREVRAHASVLREPLVPTRQLDKPSADVSFAPPWLAEGYVSTHAGFFMLLNAWHALGFHEWMGAQPRSVQLSICKVWLERWSQRLRMSAQDTQRLVWRSLPEDEIPPSTLADLATWMKRARCWLRTQAFIGPASLVLRQGVVSITQTHIDIVLPLNDIDLRVRRAGLDQNPGWVPWLGLIVAFHYVAAEDSRG
jgi:hypothetical protein